MYETITVPKVIGFLLITIGTLYYNEIFKIPGFSYRHVYQFRSVNRSLDVSTIIMNRSTMKYQNDEDSDSEDLGRALKEPLLKKGKL